MNRDEFIRQAETLNEAELLAIAEESRVRSGSRIPPEVAAKFRSLDDVTEAHELFVETAWGKTHVFMIRNAGVQEDLQPVIVNVHGGGWCLPHTERDIYFCRRLARRTGCLVVDVDYVLAPEHPYPAAIEEIEALLDHLPTLLKEWGGDPNRVILCGQSAGGNLVGAVTQRKRLPKELGILKQILCYLPTDNYTNRFGNAELSPRDESTEYYGFFYNRVFEERKNSDVFLVFANEEDVKDLPETDIITAGLDNLMPEAKQYEEILRKAGVPGIYHCFSQSRHGFLVNLYDEWLEGENLLTDLIQNVIQ